MLVNQSEIASVAGVGMCVFNDEVRQKGICWVTGSAIDVAEIVGGGGPGGKSLLCASWSLLLRSCWVLSIDPVGILMRFRWSGILITLIGLLFLRPFLAVVVFGVSPFVFLSF